MSKDMSDKTKKSEKYSILRRHGSNAFGYFNCYAWTETESSFTENDTFLQLHDNYETKWNIVTNMNMYECTHIDKHRRPVLHKDSKE